MAMIKVTAPAAYTFDEPQVQLVKAASRGLVGADRKLFEKRAGVAFLSKLDQLEHRPDEALIHVIAIGTTEGYGPNRNGDGFRDAVCARDHGTFVKYGRAYRSHINKDPQRSYGRIIASEFNAPMRRIELLIGLNATPSAAKRNGGLVADKEMEKLASGQEIPTSMAGLCPYDVCSWCHNKAKSRQEYCKSPEEGGHCKAGGLHSNIGAVVEIDNSLHHLHADNPSMRWFDLSFVYRPADRIAYVLGQLEKKAAAGKAIVGGAELAEHLGLSVPVEILASTVKTAAQSVLNDIIELAAIESEIVRSPITGLAPAFHPDVQSLDEPPPPRYREKFGQFLRALTDRQICLPLTHFLHLAGGLPMAKAAETAEVVRRYLPGIFTEMLARDDIADIVENSPFNPAAGSSGMFRVWAEKHAEALSLQEDIVRRRAQLGIICAEQPMTVQSPTMEKTSVVLEPAKRLAEQYALYQASFVGALANPQKDLIRRLVVLNNYVH